MISMLLYLSKLVEMCKHRNVVRTMGSETYTYTMNWWGEKCCTEYYSVSDEYAPLLIKKSAAQNKIPNGAFC